MPSDMICFPPPLLGRSPLGRPRASRYSSQGIVTVTQGPPPRHAKQQFPPNLLTIKGRCKGGG
eukprot:2195951-Pyramimonas_sp.AAC.1